ncbi:MAG TPA: hypothetical protein PKC98_04390, partial [Candidatus Melainabacteria bacterium]|nr:hypothetical protein [Candidatus Melainabacteria bacterium]
MTAAPQFVDHLQGVRVEPERALFVPENFPELAEHRRSGPEAEFPRDGLGVSVGVADVDGETFPDEFIGARVILARQNLPESGNRIRGQPIDE